MLRNLKGSGILKLLQQFPAGAAVILIIDHRFQVPHIGIDRETEGDHLDNRRQQGEENGGRVTHHVDKFLAQNRPGAAVGSHDFCPSASVSSTNTSSREGWTSRMLISANPCSFA